MTELPGWDRSRLRTASPADVAIARWLVFARSAQPILLRDFRGELADLQERAPREEANYQRRRRAQAREELIKALKLQDQLRRILLLEAPANG